MEYHLSYLPPQSTLKKRLSEEPFDLEWFAEYVFRARHQLKRTGLYSCPRCGTPCKVRMRHRNGGYSFICQTKASARVSRHYYEESAFQDTIFAQLTEGRLIQLIEAVYRARAGKLFLAPQLGYPKRRQILEILAYEAEQRTGESS